VTEPRDGTVQIKVCGVTSLAAAQACVDTGIDWIGLNFWPGTPRRCDLNVAEQIVSRCGSDARVVGVFVDASHDEIQMVRERTGIDWVQLHGHETPEELEALLPHAYKAVRVGDPRAVDRARQYKGDFILLDTYVRGKVGGTGTAFDWSLADAIASERRLILAGGLTPENIADAIRAVRPFGVDVASGVESAPGIKSRALIEAFMRAARGRD